MFSPKGVCLKANSVHKGEATKSFDNKNKSLKYIKIFGIITMFGSEGAALRLPDKTTSIPIHTTSNTQLSLMAQVQSEDYDFEDADAQAEAARATTFFETEEDSGTGVLCYS